MPSLSQGLGRALAGLGHPEPGRVQPPNSLTGGPWCRAKKMPRDIPPSPDPSPREHCGSSRRWLERRTALSRLPLSQGVVGLLPWGKGSPLQGAQPAQSREEPPDPCIPSCTAARLHQMEPQARQEGPGGS